MTPTTPTSTPTTSRLPAARALHMTPVRVLTLAIGVPVILALIAWTGFTLVSQAARAGFPVSYGMGVQRGQLTAGVNGAPGRRHGAHRRG